jgi:hypothetical protein
MRGTPAGTLLANAANLLFEHSLSTAIRDSRLHHVQPGAIGVLGDLLASAMNPNLRQLGAGADGRRRSRRRRCDGLRSSSAFRTDVRRRVLVSGGNMANFVVLPGRDERRKPAAMSARPAGGSERRAARGMRRAKRTPWLQKAADLFGLGPTRFDGFRSRSTSA